MTSPKDPNRPKGRRTNDSPNDRRRLPAEQMIKRDAQVLKMLRARVSYRQVAERMNMSLGSVQKAEKRARARLERLNIPTPDASINSTLTEDDEVMVIQPALDDFGAADLTAEELKDPNIWRQFDSLERYRFGLIPGGYGVPLHDDDHQQCCYAHGLDPNWRPTEHGGPSWKERTWGMATGSSTRDPGKRDGSERW